MGKKKGDSFIPKPIDYNIYNDAQRSINAGSLNVNNSVLQLPVNPLKKEDRLLKYTTQAVGGANPILIVPLVPKNKVLYITSITFSYFCTDTYAGQETIMINTASGTTSPIYYRLIWDAGFFDYDTILNFGTNLPLYEGEGLYVYRGQATKQGFNICVIGFYRDYA